MKDLTFLDKLGVERILFVDDGDAGYRSTTAYDIVKCIVNFDDEEKEEFKKLLIDEFQTITGFNDIQHNCYMNILNHLLKHSKKHVPESV